MGYSALLGLGTSFRQDISFESIDKITRIQFTLLKRIYRVTQPCMLGRNAESTPSQSVGRRTRTPTCSQGPTCPGPRRTFQTWGKSRSTLPE